MSDYWCENCDDTTIAHITDNGARCRLCGNPCKDVARVIRCLKIDLEEVQALRQLELDQYKLNAKTPF